VREGSMTHAFLCFRPLLLALGLPTLLLLGCSKSEAAPPAANERVAAATPPAATAAPAPGDPSAEAKTLFQTRCAICHGDHGAGDGPGAAALTPKPRAFADATWQASVADPQLKKTILEGGLAVGKSPGMPPNPDLQGKEEVLDALVKIVRGFSQ